MSFDQISDLPSHNYGVIVENEMDARHLLWLVNEIGEKKLIASVEKYNKKYPDDQPFVSLLLKWYRLKVPVSVYAPVNIPIYQVYIMDHIETSKIKIGFTGNWLSRVSNLSRNRSIDMFDLNRSVAIFYGNKALALEAERKAKKGFHSSKTSVPECIPYGAYGHKEWFNADVYDDMLEFIRNFNTLKERNYITLHTALNSDLWGIDKDFFDA